MDLVVLGAMTQAQLHCLLLNKFGKMQRFRGKDLSVFQIVSLHVVYLLSDNRFIVHSKNCNGNHISQNHFQLVTET